MRIKLIRYERVFNLGNYQTEKLGVEMELNSEDIPSEVMDEAKSFVYKEYAKRFKDKGE